MEVSRMKEKVSCCGLYGKPCGIEAKQGQTGK